MSGTLPLPVLIACQFGAIGIVYGALALLERYVNRSRP